MTYSENYLAHYGVKGMKWGVRHDKDVDDGATKIRGDTKKSGKRISKSLQKDIDALKSQGYTEKDAATIAKNRRTVKRILLGAAAIGVTSAVVVTMNNKYRGEIDGLIFSGTKLQTINSHEKSPNRPFYASFTPDDKLIYKSNFVDFMQNYYGGKDIYRHQISVIGNMRIASKNSSIKVLNELMEKDDDFKEKAIDLVNDVGPKYHRPGGEYEFTNSKDFKVDKDFYTIFNTNLANHDSKTQPLTDKFYSALRSKGYSGLYDLNDMSSTGYNARKPVIIFNTGKLGKDKVNRVDPSGTTKKVDDALYSFGRVSVGQLPKIYGTAGYLAGLYSINKLGQNRKIKYVNNYRKAHPNSKKTDDEIYKMYLNGEKVERK